MRNCIAARRQVRPVCKLACLVMQSCTFSSLSKVSHSRVLSICMFVSATKYTIGPIQASISTLNCEISYAIECACSQDKIRIVI